MPTPSRKSPVPGKAKEPADRNREAAHEGTGVKPAPRKNRPVPNPEEVAKRKRLRRGRRKKLLLAASALALVFVLLYYAFVFYSIEFREPEETEKLPLLIFTQGKREEDSSLEAEEVSFPGGTYLPVTVLEQYMSITQFGDYETRSFLLCDSGEYATFYLDTCTAVIGGERVFLEKPAFLQDNVLYLPIDFFHNKMNCFEYSLSSAREAEVLTFLDSVKPAFRFSPEKESSPIDPDSIPGAP